MTPPPPGAGACNEDFSAGSLPGSISGPGKPAIQEAQPKLRLTGVQISHASTNQVKSNELCDPAKLSYGGLDDSDVGVLPLACTEISLDQVPEQSAAAACADLSASDICHKPPIASKFIQDSNGLQDLDIPQKDGQTAMKMAYVAPQHELELKLVLEARFRTYVSSTARYRGPRATAPCPRWLRAIMICFGCCCRERRKLVGDGVLEMAVSQVW